MRKLVHVRFPFESAAVNHVKFSLFPAEYRGLELLRDLSSEVLDSVQILSQMLGAPDDEQAGLAAGLNSTEARATDRHYAVLTHLRTSYVNPLPREDLYTFSRLLHEAVEQLSGAGDLIVHTGAGRLSRRAAEQLEIIGRQAELASAAIGQLNNLDDLEDTWLEMVRLSKRASRTHRVWVAEVSDLQKASAIVRHRYVADQMLSAVHSLRAVADHLGRILVKES